VRQPSAPGTPVDAERLAHWINRFGGYRRNVTRARIQTWLDQFDAGDRDLAARLLDAVEFVSNQQVEANLANTLRALPGWDPVRRRREGEWRFVAFSRAAGESGDTMLHKLRSAARLSQSHFNRMFINKRDLLRENLGPDDSVVFVDDFAGTGEQVCTGWKEIMQELLPGGPRVYLVLVAANMHAIHRIHNETPIIVRTPRELDDGDNLFVDDCTVFSQGEKDSLFRYCRKANRKSPKGYGDCGFVFVLAHKAPNNSIPILHAAHNRWDGLFPRL